MEIEERDASDVKHLLYSEQQYITSAHFFLPNIHIKISKLVRTQFELGLRTTLKSLRVQPPSTAKLDREYITLDPTLLLEEDCLDKQQPQIAESGERRQSQYEKQHPEVNKTDNRTLAIHS